MVPEKESKIGTDKHSPRSRIKRCRKCLASLICLPRIVRLESNSVRNLPLPLLDSGFGQRFGLRV